MGVTRHFIQGASFIMWCNISLTCAIVVGCAPQIRTLFLKRFNFFKSHREAARDSLIAPPEDRNSQPSSTVEQNENETKKKGTALVLSNKFLSGDGKVAVGDARLSDNASSGESDIV